MKNSTRIVVSTFLFLTLLAGALMWTRNSPQVSEGREPVVTGAAQSSTEPARDIRALGLDSAANRDIVQGNYDQGIEKYRQSLRIQKDPDTQIHLAVVLLRMKRKDEALQLLRDVAQKQDRAGKSAQEILSKLEQNPNWGMPKK